jgi:aspartate carbamoyltransferase regulatory subunit
MTTKTLSVSAINNGTVIDHIRSGYALLVIHLFRLLHDKNKVTVGLNLPSKRLGLKDIIKIENRVLTLEEANEIAIFAPEATINIVKDFEVTEKVVTSLPTKIENIFLCPNPNCITHAESSESLFYLEGQGKKVQLNCHYCEKAFDRDQVKISTQSKIRYF